MRRADQGATVAVLGASPREERYSYQAVKMLTEHGFKAIPVHPAGHTVLGIPGKTSLQEIAEAVDTLTMYVGASISDKELDHILTLNPKRVVFNPGSENPTLARKLRDAGIEVVEACTLVMLRTDQF
jgi:hypothetical protein